MELAAIQALVRDVPDFPKEGVVFKDITPLLGNDEAFAAIVDLIVAHYGRGNVDRVAGIEARGFILAAPVAYHLGAGFVPIRKEGKLPWESEAEEYVLEYGSATLEVHRDAVLPGERVLLVDDVLATGGTLQATAALIERLGGEIVGIACPLELTLLNGRDKVRDYDLFSLIQY